MYFKLQQNACAYPDMGVLKYFNRKSDDILGLYEQFPVKIFFFKKFYFFDTKIPYL